MNIKEAINYFSILKENNFNSKIYYIEPSISNLSSFDFINIFSIIKHYQVQSIGKIALSHPSIE